MCVSIHSVYRYFSVYIYTLYIYIHLYIIYIFIFIYSNMYIYTTIDTYIYVLDTNICMYYIYVYTYVCMYVCTYVHIYTYTYTYTYIYINANIFLYLYIYMHACTHLQSVDPSIDLSAQIRRSERTARFFNWKSQKESERVILKGCQVWEKGSIFWRISRIFVGSVLGSSEGSCRGFPIFFRKNREKPQKSEILSFLQEILGSSNWPFLKNLKTEPKNPQRDRKKQDIFIDVLFFCVVFLDVLFFFGPWENQHKTGLPQKTRHSLFCYDQDTKT